MEKDNFKDRTIETTYIQSIKIGDYVYICEKQMQKCAKTIEDLTYGKVIKILTKHDHPRGIKVCIVTSTNRQAIGRVVYLTKDGKMLTKSK